MTLVLIEVPNEAAVERLRQQPGVRVVGVVAPQLPPPPAAPRQWAGSIPAASAGNWDKHLQGIRDEWKHDI